MTRLERGHDERNVPGPRLDAELARVASLQHGVVALWQLVDLGLSASAVRSRVGAGRLHRAHRGVFAVGHPSLTRDGRLLAAVLACGPSAELSHRAAAGKWELGLAGRTWVDVTAPGSRGRRRPGIRVHSAATLHPADVTVVDAIPCTTVARTLLDVCEDATRREIERACDRAEARRLLDMRAIEEVLSRANGRRGSGLLRSVLGVHSVGSTLTRNELEERFLAICRGA
ncbi:MAG TPA: type IV toxin-antitoxin system AbiEi family antitoxin domain-containing protein, partial [Solirubrobacteraceae bacterium]|nr:type IV toxin-antitoxin system AbiEi family antitoxin domain-containing protein [Solirubrobacteraceae bacterium]